VVTLTAFRGITVGVAPDARWRAPHHGARADVGGYHGQIVGLIDRNTRSILRAIADIPRK
jgi:hypothetical protein